MKQHPLKIEGIPAILWGEASTKLILAIHGNLSSKSDIPIQILAEEAVPLGYQVLSFDLPEHGDRKEEAALCKVQRCVWELEKIMAFAKAQFSSISIWANSIGAYFSLLAYQNKTLKQCLFLSPVVDMQVMIEQMMEWFAISEERLSQEQEIKTPAGQVLYWDYYQYVKNHPITKWDNPTVILYGKKDGLCGFDILSAFTKRFDCGLTISESSEHYFFTEKDLAVYRRWLQDHLI